MISIQSVLDSMARIRGDLLVLMQEGTEPGELPSGEWADKMYDAWEAQGDVMDLILQARLLQ